MDAPTFPIAIYDAAVRPRVRCAIDRLNLGPGEVSLLQNARTDHGAMIVRVADSVLNASPPTGAKVTAGVYFPRGDFQGFLNGTAYWISAWDMTAGGTAIFYQDLTTGAYTEITDPGNASASTWGGSSTGKTRFATQANVTYSVVPIPRRVAAGAATPSVDDLVIQNGEDYPIIWVPGLGLVAQAQTYWITPIVLPSLADTFHVLASGSAFWLVKGNAKTYYANAGPPKVNQASFLFADSLTVYGVSDATLRVPKLTLKAATPGTGDIATVQFPVSGTSYSGVVQESFGGKWLNMVWEGSSTNIQFLFKDTKIEIGKESVGYATVSTWTTIYDPTSSDVSVSTLPSLVAVDAGNNRYLLAFNLQNITTLATRTAYHLRFTRTSAAAPAADFSLFLLAVFSAGRGGGFPFGTEWTITYSDYFTWAESVPFPQTHTDMDLLANVGGPRGPDANVSSPIMLPRDTSVWYDYRLKVKIADSITTINGGLQGQPNVVNIYFRDPSTDANGNPVQPVAFYFSDYVLWNQGGADPPYQWTSATTAGAGGTETLRTEFAQNGSTAQDGCGYGIFGQVDFKAVDPGRPTPSNYVQSMPKAAVMFSAMGRLFCGNIKYDTGAYSTTRYSRGELRFSDKGFFNRWRSVEDINDPNSGGNLIFEGETVKAGKTCAAAAENAVTIYVWTDKSYNALGTAGGYTFTGSGFGTLQIGTKYRISADGTNEPGSIIEHNGRLAWCNDDGHFVFAEGGQPVNISLGNVTNSQGISNSSVLDVVADIPASRRGHMRGIFSRHRFIWFMTPSGATVNSRGVIFDESDGLWESIDTLTDGEMATSIYDASLAGAGQRILIHGSDGVSRAYEEGSGSVALRLKTRGYKSQELFGRGWTPGCSWSTREVEVVSELDSGKTMTIDAYKNMGTASTYQFSLALDAMLNDEWIDKAIPASGTVVAGWANYFDVNATMTGGKKLTQISAYASLDQSDSRGSG